MHRRQVLKTILTATVGASLPPGRILAQEAGTSEASTIHVHPETGADNNSGARGSPLKTLAAAARRVNESRGTAPMTILLSEGVYPVNEPALFKPVHRSFTKVGRPTVRAEVLPDAPGWSPQRMPVLVVVNHCVFFGCKITVVYWTGQAHGCAMRNTLAYGNYVAGAWLCATGEDFEFRDNVMSANQSALLFQGTVRKYNLANSVFAANQNLYGAGFGPPVNFKALKPSVLGLPASSKVIDKPVEIEMDQSKRDYLHVVAGTPGSGIAAGLFSKRV